MLKPSCGLLRPKIPIACYEMIKEYEKEGVVFIAVTGRSNALSGFTDAQISCPLIARPPYSDTFGGADIFSGRRMPSAFAAMIVMAHSNAALAAAKILGLTDVSIRNKIINFQAETKDVLIRDDKKIHEL